jgi:hypothetical protein
MNQHPDQIDMMDEYELRRELRKVLQQLFEANIRPDWSLVDAKQKEIERLREYAEHKDWCNMRHRNARENNSITSECDCGFKEIVK